VGQTLNSAFHRFQSHVNGAKRIFRTGERKDTNPLHKHMAYVGWQGFRIYPLEKIPGSFPQNQAGRTQFRQTALHREVFWKRVLHAFLPTGLCVEGKKPRRVRSPQATMSATGEQDSDLTHTNLQQLNNNNMASRRGTLSVRPGTYSIVLWPDASHPYNSIHTRPVTLDECTTHYSRTPQSIGV